MLEEFSNEPLISLKVPSHVLTKLIVVPYVKCSYVRFRIVLTGSGGARKGIEEGYKLISGAIPKVTTN